MTTPIPTIGRIVLYTLTDHDAETINRRRDHALSHMDEHREAATGVMVHVGNAVRAGDTFPMVITRPWGADPLSCVNGTVFLDGSDTFWACSRSVDTSDGAPVGGMWRWPQR